LRWTLNPP